MGLVYLMVPQDSLAEMEARVVVAVVHIMHLREQESPDKGLAGVAHQTRIRVEVVEVQGGLGPGLVQVEMAFYALCKRLVQIILHIIGEEAVRAAKDAVVILGWLGD